MKRNPNYVDYFFYIWALLLVVAFLFTKSSATDDKCRYFEEKNAASLLASEAMAEIKAYKGELNIPLSAEDNYHSGMIGDRYTVITTTLGNLQSKKTSVNPNFAAVIIDMFKEAGIKPGD
jgi:poly-gamma-glutamate system protein